MHLFVIFLWMFCGFANGAENIGNMSVFTVDKFLKDIRKKMKGVDNKNIFFADQDSAIGHRISSVYLDQYELVVSYQTSVSRQRVGINLFIEKIQKNEDELCINFRTSGFRMIFKTLEAYHEGVAVFYNSYLYLKRKKVILTDEIIRNNRLFMRLKASLPSEAYSKEIEDDGFIKGGFFCVGNNKLREYIKKKKNLRTVKELTKDFELRVLRRYVPVFNREIKANTGSKMTEHFAAFARLLLRKFADQEYMLIDFKAEDLKNLIKLVNLIFPEECSDYISNLLGSESFKRFLDRVALNQGEKLKDILRFGASKEGFLSFLYNENSYLYLLKMQAQTFGLDDSKHTYCAYVRVLCVIEKMLAESKSGVDLDFLKSLIQQKFVAKELDFFPVDGRYNQVGFVIKKYIKWRGSSECYNVKILDLLREGLSNFLYHDLAIHHLDKIDEIFPLYCEIFNQYS